MQGENNCISTAAAPANYDMQSNYNTSKIDYTVVDSILQVTTWLKGFNLAISGFILGH